MNELDRILDLAMAFHMPDAETTQRICDSVLEKPDFSPWGIQQWTNTIFQNAFQCFSTLMNQQASA